MLSMIAVARMMRIVSNIFYTSLSKAYSKCRLILYHVSISWIGSFFILWKGGEKVMKEIIEKHFENMVDEILLSSET